MGYRQWVVPYKLEFILWNRLFKIIGTAYYSKEIVHTIWPKKLKQKL